MFRREGMLLVTPRDLSFFHQCVSVQIKHRQDCKYPKMQGRITECTDSNKQNISKNTPIESHTPHVHDDWLCSFSFSSLFSAAITTSPLPGTNLKDEKPRVGVRVVA